MYQTLNDSITGTPSGIKRLADNAFIPFDPANSDFVEYQRWLEAGNTPEPAEPQE